MFIIKITVKDKDLLETFKEMTCYNVESLENLYLKPNAIIAIASAKKKK